MTSGLYDYTLVVGSSLRRNLAICIKFDLEYHNLSFACECDTPVLFKFLAISKAKPSSYVNTNFNVDYYLSIC